MSRQQGNDRRQQRSPQRRRGSGQGKVKLDAARLTALKTLTAVREEGSYANLVLPTLIEEAKLDTRDAAFATELSYGTIRLQGRYDAIIAQCVDRPLDRIDPAVLDVLRLGAHQLLGMRVPTHAAVSATVDLASGTCGRGASSFVNAILRRVSERTLAEWIERIAQNSKTELAALAAQESHPVWITKGLRQALMAFDRDSGELSALLQADNQNPDVTLCARPGLIEPAELANETRRATLHSTHPGRLSRYAVVMEGGDPGRVGSVRAARGGVEDEGSQLVALMLAEAELAGRDEQWLDMCAGPGGKAALLGACAAQRGAHLVANEITPHRLGLVKGSVHALPETVVELRGEDGRSYGLEEPGKYDRVLLDAPCSGLGSLRRRPEARWRREPADVTELAALQRELLVSALQTVRPGGIVAYVTCSPHILETTLAVKDVLKKVENGKVPGVSGVERLHAGAVAAEVSLEPPAGSDQEMLQLWPHLDGTDAMFIALLRRQN